jgi:NADH dehydrogenase
MGGKLRVCVLGGTGFVGRHLVARLAQEGHQIKVLTRRRERHRDLLVLPTVSVVDADVRDEATLAREFRGMDAIINLVGILNESSRAKFRDVHVELPRRIIAACRKSGVKRVLHMSALNADAGRGASVYLRSKGEGENAMHAESGIAVTSFRPSVIFGPDDAFFNRFAAYLRMSFLIFPLASPNARLAPVYVSDVVEAFARALTRRATAGHRYDLCGPRAYTLRELVEYTAQQIGVRRRVVGLGPRLSALFAGLMEWMPGKPMSRDNLASLRGDSTCKGEFPAVFDITPTPIEAVVPVYLTRRNTRRRFYNMREKARRD